MKWKIYLSGEIHTNWRDELKLGAHDARLNVEFLGPETDQAGPQVGPAGPKSGPTGPKGGPTGPKGSPTGGKVSESDRFEKSFKAQGLPYI